MTEYNQSSNRSAPHLRDGRFRGAGEQLSIVANSAKDTALEFGSHYVTEPAQDLFGLLQGYAKSRPEVAAAWCFGLGLFLGWKLRP
jgi:hypothetical protein